MKTTTLTAPDIECEGCANSIKKSVGTLGGVREIQVDIDAKKITVAHDDETMPDQIKAAVEKAGFTTR